MRILPASVLCQRRWLRVPTPFQPLRVIPLLNKAEFLGEKASRQASYSVLFTNGICSAGSSPCFDAYPPAIQSQKYQ